MKRVFPEESSIRTIIYPTKLPNFRVAKMSSRENDEDAKDEDSKDEKPEKEKKIKQKIEVHVTENVRFSHNMA